MDGIEIDTPAASLSLTYLHHEFSRKADRPFRGCGASAHSFRRDDTDMLEWVGTSITCHERLSSSIAFYLISATKIKTAQVLSR